MVVEMSQAFAFNDLTIDFAVNKKSPGVYMLGYTENNVFYVQRVGRSDYDLNARLKSAEYSGQFKQFKARYCATVEEAYRAECTLWHQYGGTLNPNHPARAKGALTRCSHCSL